MNSFQRYLSLSAAALLTFATAALAEPPVNSAASGEGETSSFFCHAAVCETNQDCEAACSTAQTATCVANECHYTYPGSGGGGGGGGPICSPMLCSSNEECVCGTKQGYCGTDQVCVF